jgi:L-alanine-DL-glutamate epimerase-like enolase superfamily enzyme
MRITDLKCAVIGQHPVVRIVADEGLDGYAQVESRKSYLKPHILFYRELILGQDPTNVERVMRRIRRLGSFKPWGSAVSAIETALWDVAGKAAGVPVYKLLGGKVRDRVRVYNGGVRFGPHALSPEGYAQSMAEMKAAKEGFTIIKQGVAFHGNGDAKRVPGYLYSEVQEGGRLPSQSAPLDVYTRGPMTERGLKHTIACIEAMKSVLGDDVGLALDCGPGMTVADTIRLARALEPLNLMWLEDTINGNYEPFVSAALYREVTQSTSTPIHTGEQIYLRQNFCDLIEKHAVRVIGPDPGDVGGIAELKWIAEHADLHGIMVAPHGIINGLFGLAAQVHLAATLPDNYIAFEYPVARPDWWYDIVTGLPDPIVRDGFIQVWDAPGLGVSFDVAAAKQYLREEDTEFFD